VNPCPAVVIKVTKFKITLGFNVFLDRIFFFTVVPYILILSKFVIHELMHKGISLKRILKLTLQQLLHVSVQTPSSGSTEHTHTPTRN